MDSFAAPISAQRGLAKKKLLLKLSCLNKTSIILDSFIQKTIKFFEAFCILDDIHHIWPVNESNS